MQIVKCYSFVYLYYNWPLSFLQSFVIRVCICVLWPSHGKFPSQVTGICGMQVEHVTAQELGNARYGLDMTWQKGHMSLNEPRARCC